MTIGRFYRPSGASTQIKGVVADIILPSETDLPDIGESKLPYALPWDILSPTTYTKFDLVLPVLAALREKSGARVAADPGFRLVLEARAMAEKDEEAKMLSLNEAERRLVKMQADEIGAEMMKVVLANAARTPPAYDLTLTKVDSAGLPLARKPASPGVDTEPAENNPNEDIELRETENILADYIHALPACPAGVIVAGTKIETTAERAANDK